MRPGGRFSKCNKTLHSSPLFRIIQLLPNSSITFEKFSKKKMVLNVFPISIFHNTWVVALLFCWTISSKYPYGVRYRYEMVGYETEITKTAFRRCGSGNSGINPASYQITSQLTNRLSQRNSLILPTRQKLANCTKHIFCSIRQGACDALLPVFQKQ